VALFSGLGLSAGIPGVQARTSNTNSQSDDIRERIQELLLRGDHEKANSLAEDHAIEHHVSHGREEKTVEPVTVAGSDEESADAGGDSDGGLIRPNGQKMTKEETNIWCSLTELSEADMYLATGTFSYSRESDSMFWGRCD
jgi:hypothetical protein